MGKTAFKHSATTDQMNIVVRFMHVFIMKAGCSTSEFFIFCGLSF